MKEYIFDMGDALYDMDTGEAVFKPKVVGNLVRCCECKHFEMLKNQAYGFCHNMMVDELFHPDDFCSYGERGEEDE